MLLDGGRTSTSNGKRTKASSAEALRVAASDGLEYVEHDRHRAVYHDSATDEALGEPQAMLGWSVAALIAIADGLVWSELGAAMPGSSGTYRYLRKGFGAKPMVA